MASYHPRSVHWHEPSNVYVVAILVFCCKLRVMPDLALIKSCFNMCNLIVHHSAPGYIAWIAPWLIARHRTVLEQFRFGSSVSSWLEYGRGTNARTKFRKGLDIWILRCQLQIGVGLLSIYSIARWEFEVAPEVCEVACSCLHILRLEYEADNCEQCRAWLNTHIDKHFYNDIFYMSKRCSTNCRSRLWNIFTAYRGRCCGWCWRCYHQPS